MAEIVTGGCQCGAIRYRFTERPQGAHVCHCRMCQKAFGGFYAALVGGPADTFELTRGELAIFRSSDPCERGFCAACGTPLTFRYVDSASIGVSIGSLDDPSAFPPVDQHGVESRLPFVNAIGSLPDRPPTEAEDELAAAAIAATNHQHPDHDTTEWPPRGPQ